MQADVGYVGYVGYRFLDAGRAHAVGPLALLVVFVGNVGYQKQIANIANKILGFTLLALWHCQHLARMGLTFGPFVGTFLEKTKSRGPSVELQHTVVYIQHKFRIFKSDK